MEEKFLNIPKFNGGPCWFAPTTSAVMNNFNRIIRDKKIGLILYARMSSKRFHGKVLEKVYDNKNILKIIIINLKKINLWQSKRFK